jgi:hypothetical protein
LNTLVEDKAWLVTDAACPPPIRHESLQLFLSCHQLLHLTAAPAAVDARPLPLPSLLKDATRRVLEEQGLFLADDEGGATAAATVAALPPVPGLAALVAWATRWRLLFSLSEQNGAAFAVLLARGLGQQGQGLLEVRRESLRVLLLSLGGGGGGGAVVDLGDGRTEDERGEEERMMELQVHEAIAATAAVGVLGFGTEAGLVVVEALVGQVRREANPSLLKGQLAALCLLRSGDAAGGRQRWQRQGQEEEKELWAFVSRLAGEGGGEEEGEEEEDGGETAAWALELLGHLLPPMQKERGERAMESWLRHVQRAARPEHRPALRMAALRSIAASGILLLQASSNSGDAGADAGVVVGALLTALRLAHDDDDGVRAAACVLLARGLVDGSGGFVERGGRWGDGTTFASPPTLLDFWLAHSLVHPFLHSRPLPPRHALPEPASECCAHTDGGI